ncbi:hypothetical protein GPJ59_31230, partial [Streptomyces bambusae]|nr:hypothetical protein [Streptomyces bambusae]
PGAEAGSGSRAASGDDFEALVARARAARDEGHPGAEALWDELARRAQARGRDDIDATVAADLLEHQVLAAARAGDPAVRERFALVRDAHRQAGQEDRAVLAELRLAMAALQFDAEPAEVRALLDAAEASARGLPSDDPVRARRLASVELTRIRALAHLGAGEDGHDAEHGQDAEDGQDGTRAALAGFVAAHAGDPALVVQTCDAEELLAHHALRSGDTAAGEALLASAAERAVAAGRPWLAVDPLAVRGGALMQLGRPAEAEESVRAALAHAAETADAQTQGAVRLTLADIVLHRRGDAAEVAALALDSAHWFDQAGLAEYGGAQARLRLTRAYAGLGRHAEAVEVLQSALPDLLEHGEDVAVDARDLLARLLSEVGDQRGAAEQYLLAAEAAKSWHDPRAQAHLAQAAADALSSAGLDEEAVAAYERALELRRAIGDSPVAVVRMLRSLAWLELRTVTENATVAAARKRMDEAVRVLEDALAAADAAEGEEDEEHLRYELAQTWQQLGRILDQRIDAYVSPEDHGYREGGDEPEVPEELTEAQLLALRQEAIALWDRAAGIYAGLGPGCLTERYQCVTGAAEIERDMDVRPAAVARVTALVEEVRQLPEGAAPEWLLPQAEWLLTSLGE